MTEDEIALHNLIPDVLKTLDLSNEITEPNVTTNMNLVEDLDVTLEIDQELGRTLITKGSELTCEKSLLKREE
ncbi:hypothetical protein F0562_010389 [Nyssa sinensis]|uniref:Uncharacterized protein n=1 Tax=Nyssa sinensis TaxID=561372 RepID=A0A5J5A134_9ASTE|nr:hypothetical protein F0562_010389 [Nyssa sinensis]